MAKIINGKEISEFVKSNIAKQVEALKQQGFPTLSKVNTLEG